MEKHRKQIIARSDDPVFINPTSDWGFHRIFASPANSHLLRYLLNTLIDDKNILTATLRDPNHTYLTVNEGKSEFDIYCTCDDGTNIIVEMQKNNEGNFQDRAFAYTAMAVMDQAQTHWDYRIDKIYFIGITNFNLFKDSNKYFTRIMLSDIDEKHKPIYDKYLQIFIELPKFVAEDTELNDERDALVYILKNLRTMDRLPEWIQKHKDIKMICDSARFGSLSETEKEDYIMTEEKERNWIRCVKYSREEGREEGRKEERVQVALNLKHLDTPLNIISKATGLSMEEIEKL